MRLLTVSYNLMELVSSYLPPALSSQASGATNYQYDLDKELIEIDRPDGAKVNFTYDPVSALLTNIATPTGPFSFSYVPNSNLAAKIVSPDNEIMNYTYVGNVPTVVTSSGPVLNAVDYSYNTDGTLLQIAVKSTLTSGTPVNLSYDKDGLLIQSGDESFIRNNFGAISNVNLGNVSESNTFDNFGQISTQKYQVKNKDPFSSVAYTRDNLERIISVDETRSDGDTDKRDDDRHNDGKSNGKHNGKNDKGNPGYSYDYDLQGRLIHVKKNSNLVRSYIYDQNGNRTEKLSLDNKILAQYDAQDRLITYGNTEFQYNANGDLTAKIQHQTDFDDHSFWGGIFYRLDKNDTRQTQYAYDVFGNLKSVILPDGRQIDYIIDGQNRRVGKKVNGKLVHGYIYQNQTQIAAEIDGKGNITKQFIYGEKVNIPDYMIMNGKEYRIISNQVGTPELIVDVSTGEVIEELNFDEFGIPRNRLERSIIPFGFAGGIYDHDTGLVRFGDRDYSPETGRWLQRDPILFNGGSANLYGYVLNDPVNRIDPSGLWTFQGGVGGTIGGVSFGGGIAVDGQGNLGGYYYGGYMPGTAPNGGGLSCQVSNGSSITSLNGGFWNTSYGASVDGFGASVDTFGGTTDGQSVTGGGFTIGPYVGAGAGAGPTTTTVVPIW